MVNLNYPLVEKLLGVLEGEPEFAAIAAAHSLDAFVSVFFDPRSNKPATFLSPSLSPQDADKSQGSQQRPAE